jgi:TolB-like protein/tetratricopeptide (TPR) repeat protein
MGTPNFVAAGSQHIETPKPEAVNAQLHKLVQSRYFARSGRMRRFLQFAVQHALAGTGDQIKEYSVGVEVFDRKRDYDPRTDPIVRVEARRLRDKLRAYYKTEGQNDSVVIELPKGAYMPVFGSRVASAAVEPAETPQTAVAVLPFANLSPEVEDDYFSDGLTEELILLLTRIKELRVVAWHSASQFRGREQDLSSIREELKVGVILRGSVRRTDSRVRVMAQLIDTRSGAYLWSEGFDRGTHDVLAIQEEIARAIVSTLRLALDFTRVSISPTKKLNVECYNLCLQARFHARGRTSAGLRKSLECYERAIERDPGSSPAHAGLADTYSLLADYGVMNPKDVMPRAEAAARTALELDPNSAEACSGLAYIRSLFDWKWQEAEALYRRAIALNPGSSKSRHWFSIDFLALLGRFDEAEPEIQFARDLDPLSLIIHEGSPYLSLLRRDYDSAFREFQQLADLDSSFYKAYSGMGRVLSLLGRYDEAIVMLKAALRVAGDIPNITGALGQTLALAGRRDDAMRCLDELHAAARVRYVPSTCFAILHLGLGQFDQSLDWLERACDQHELPITMAKVHPVYDPLRSHSRFNPILARLGFLP